MALKEVAFGMSGELAATAHLRWICLFRLGGQGGMGARLGGAALDFCGGCRIHAGLQPGALMRFWSLNMCRSCSQASSHRCC